MSGTVFNNSVKKAFQLLEVFSHDKPEWGVTEMAKELKANKSTVYRILSTLQSVGAVAQDPDTEKYRLGFKLFELGSRLTLKQVLLPKLHNFLVDVAAQITETVQLGVLNQGRVLIVDQVVSPLGLRLNFETGSSLPLHASASGKVFLAFAEGLAGQYQSTQLEAFTPFTTVEFNLLKKQLDDIFAHCYCLEIEEYERGLVSIAVPVFNEEGSITACLSVSGPASRFNKKKLTGYLNILNSAKAKMEETLIGFSVGNLF